MADLHVDFLGKRLAGPVIAASGTFGFGPEYAGIEDLRVLGGILTGKDALEFIMAGAAAVQVGTANFLDPKACTRITNEIGQWMDAHGVKTLDEIRGCAR